MALRIDLEEVLKAKSPKWYRRLPKFVIRWLKKTIHQDDMNDFLLYHSDDAPLDFANNVVKMLGAHLEVTNEEKVPKTGRYIIVSNHPLGGLDGLCHISLLSRYRTDIKLPVNDLLMNVKPMHGIFIPINKHGSLDRHAVQELNDTFASDDIIVYFPAGLCSRKQKGGVIRDLEWKPTIVTKGRHTCISCRLRNVAGCFHSAPSNPTTPPARNPQNRCNGRGRAHPACGTSRDKARKP